MVNSYDSDFLANKPFHAFNPAAILAIFQLLYTKNTSHIRLLLDHESVESAALPSLACYKLWFMDCIRGRP